MSILNGREYTVALFMALNKYGYAELFPEPFLEDLLAEMDARLAAAGGITSISQIPDWPEGITATELARLDGLTGDIQAQLNSKVGVAEVASQAAENAYFAAAPVGAMAIRTDLLGGTTTTAAGTTTTPAPTTTTTTPAPTTTTTTPAGTTTTPAGTTTTPAGTTTTAAPTTTTTTTTTAAPTTTTTTAAPTTTTTTAAPSGLNYTFDSDINGFGAPENLYGTATSKTTSHATSGWANGEGDGYLKFDITANASSGDRRAVVKSTAAFDFSWDGATGKKIAVKCSWGAIGDVCSQMVRLVDAADAGKWIEGVNIGNDGENPGYVQGNSQAGSDRDNSLPEILDGQYMVFRRSGANQVTIGISNDGGTTLVSQSNPITMTGISDTVYVWLGVGIEWPSNTSHTAYFENVREV